MENRGKLLISTKTKAGRKTLLTVCSVIMLIMGTFIAFNFNLFRELGKEVLDNATIGVIIGLVAVVYLFLYPVITMIGNRSYCEIYENAVVGMTSLSLSQPNMPMQKFEITYDEIMNTTEAGKTLHIYTQYATYDVLAMKNRSAVANEIRARISSKNQINSGFSAETKRTV